MQLPVLSTRAARIAFVIAVLVWPAAAWAQETRTVHAAMIFSAEAGPLPTTACIQLTERAYPPGNWWEQPVTEGSAPDRAFKAVIAAIRKKDRAALVKLTSPAQARNTAEFDRQANSFFQQFESIHLLAVRRAYEFDGLVVFFGVFRSESQTAVVPLVFAHEADDTLGFLPSRTKGVAYTLVTDWFTSSAGLAADSPAYCDEPAVKRATHRVSLSSSSWRPSALLLTGAPLDAPGPLSTVVTRVKPTIDQMKKTLGGPDVSGFFRHMTPGGGGRLQQWFMTAARNETDAYKAAFIEQEPFFVFDASPLLIVYTRTAAREIQVLYFTVTADMRLLWTNSSYITVADQVFKQGRLFTAAASTPPFSGVAIK